MAITQSGTYNKQQVQIISVNSILVCLSITAVALRFWARSIQRVSFYADDWLILVALFLALAINILLFYSNHVGLADHVDELEPETIVAYSLVSSPCGKQICHWLTILEPLHHATLLEHGTADYETLDSAILEASLHGSIDEIRLLRPNGVPGHVVHCVSNYCGLSVHTDPT